jgi:hypothetical protein
MQIQRLQELISAPGKTQLSDRNGLIEWVHKYPYAGAFSMLLARSSAVGGHIHQQADLMRAAAASSLRQPLFDLILRTELIEEARQIDQVIEASLDPVSEEIGVEKVGLESVHVAGGDEAQKTLLDAEDPVEREALIAAIGRSIEKEVASWTADEEKVPSEALTTEDALRLRNAASSPFSIWLSSRAEALNYGEAMARDGGEKEVLKTSDDAALIDRFIASSPRIGPMREPTSDVHALAQASVMEDATLVTETMARLYANQGQIMKARKAYELLALKNPAKSTYFASQLKKLDEGGLD